MLPNDAVLLDIVETKEGLATLLTRSNIHISMSTVSPQTVEQVDQLHKQNGTGFVVAPVLGRPEAAENRKLWFFLSGNKRLKIKLNEIFLQLGQGVYDCGEEISLSSKIKLAINFMILTAIESMGEAFDFIEKVGIDRDQFAHIVRNTLFDCLAYRYHADNIAKRKFEPAGFKLSLGLKDINLLLDVSGKKNVPLPLANLLHSRLLASLAKNRGDLDWGAITINSAENAGMVK